MFRGFPLSVTIDYQLIISFIEAAPDPGGSSYSDGHNMEHRGNHVTHTRTEKKIAKLSAHEAVTRSRGAATPSFN